MPGLADMHAHTSENEFPLFLANGVTLGSDMWLHDQPTDYYRRHLLLHEGTHAFMIAFLGGITFPMSKRIDNFMELKYHVLSGSEQLKLNWGLAVGF